MLTPVDQLSMVRSVIIAVDQVMEVDKAELIPVKTLAIAVSVCSWFGG